MDRLAAGARGLMLVSGETQMNRVQEQTVQSLVQSLVDMTVESDPKSQGHFWPLNYRDR